MSSKYVDSTATLQVIGAVFKEPHLLDLEDKYTITENDFDDEFHKIVFGTIYKVYELGAEKISLQNIRDFLASRPKNEAIFNKNKGDEWLLKTEENCQPEAFDYYYGRLKKFSLLRAFDKIGVDVSDIYDPDNIFDAKKKQQQEELLDGSSCEDIVNKVNNKIEDIKIRYVDNDTEEASQAGKGARELVAELKAHPEVGSPLYGSLINTVTRGARLGKLYLRSAPTGCGKSRSMIADACYIACDEIYNSQFGCWMHNGVKQPTLFIATEQDLSEVQTMMIAFLSDVNEEHILNGIYLDGEEERVQKAIDILEDSPLYVEYIADFSLQDIENKIKKNIREHEINYAFFDYIHSSMKILEEITHKSGGVKLREDNVLFMLATRLKDICNQYGIFMMTSTQLNGAYQDSETPDQNLLRGAKSIGDRIDWGGILLPVTDDDLVKLEPVLATNVFERPSLKLSIYKNRRGRYKSVYLWCSADLGTCRINPQFCTTYGYELVSIDNTSIQVHEEESAF